jgi:Myb/SANT-like DNA-binding domain
MEEHFQHFHFTNPYLNIPPPIPPIPPIPPPPQLPPNILPPPPVQSDPVDRERLPQWTHNETAEFLSIRADLDASFMSTKRNKPLWEAISARLQQKGFIRTPDQCKSKWKNLVTRFKVKYFYVSYIAINYLMEIDCRCKLFFLVFHQKSENFL